MEQARKLAAWAAGAVFAASFAGLLVLSATSYWRPDNSLVSLCDQIWKTSGVLFLVLTLVPYAATLVRRG